MKLSKEQIQDKAVQLELTEAGWTIDLEKEQATCSEFKKHQIITAIINVCWTKKF